MASNRIGRINEEIQKELASLIRNLKDPRVQDTMISITRVETTPDLGYTKIYVSFLQEERAKEAERSVVDMETLQHTNQQLISTLDEVMKIQTEGAQKRREAELELGRIEGELKQKLLELRG